nr:hypothetical protein Iba_chr06bCG10030 [Ipomoea batatas]
MSLTAALLLAPLSPHQPWRKAKGNTVLGSEDSAVSVQELQIWKCSLWWKRRAGETMPEDPDWCALRILGYAGPQVAWYPVENDF